MWSKFVSRLSAHRERSSFWRITFLRFSMYFVAFQLLLTRSVTRSFRVSLASIVVISARLLLQRLSGTIQKKARPKRRNLKRRTRGSTCIRLLPLLVDLNFFFLADNSYLKIQHLRRSFDHRPVQARPTQTPMFWLLLKPSSTRLFPCSSGTGPSSPCEISALRPRSMRSPQPCSRKMKSALSSLSMRSLSSLARCRTLIPSRR